MPPATGVLARRATATAPARQAPAPRPARQAPLRVVGAAPRRARQRLLRFSALLLLTGSLLGVVFGHAMLAQEQIKLSGAQARLSAEQALHRQLLLSVAQAETPSRIVAAAERLHMVQPAHIVQLPSVPLTTPTTTVPPATHTSATSTADGRSATAATR
jgi:hypothetical protein